MPELEILRFNRTAGGESVQTYEIDIDDMHAESLDGLLSHPVERMGLARENEEATATKALLAWSWIR